MFFTVRGTWYRYRPSALRGLQAISVQFRFAFSKPSSAQTRFLRPVAAPAEVAHFCRYKKKLPNLRFEGWILETILLSTKSTLQNANWPKNIFFSSDRWATSAGAATGRFRKRKSELDACCL